MHSIRQGVQRLVSPSTFHANNTTWLSSIQRLFYGYNDTENERKSRFTDYNKVIFPPQKPGEEPRPGYVCHVKHNIKYSPLKMWYIACFVRGMSVDEAVKQLSFMKYKGAAIAKEVILEAQQMAVDEHNIEFKSNLWVAESFATKGIVVKGLRRHARGKRGIVHYRHCHYHIRLEEGKPPKNYYVKPLSAGPEMFEDWMRMMHNRKVINSL